MATNYNVTTALSICCTLITLTVQMDWTVLPSGSLKNQIPELFNELKQNNTQLKEVGKQAVLENPKGIQCAEKEIYPEGPMRTFVTIAFQANQGKVVNKLVGVVALGKTVTDTKEKRSIYYYLAGKSVKSYKTDEDFVAVHQEAMKEAERILGQLKLETVHWYNGSWPDITLEETNATVNPQILTRLRLLAVPVSTKGMLIENVKFGSIHPEPDNSSTLRCAVYKLTKFGKAQAVAQKITQGKSDLIGFGSREKFFCVVLDKRPGISQVIYASNPTLSESEAFGDAERFATEYVLWYTRDEDKTAFDQLLGSKTKDLQFLVAKTIIRQEILKNRLANCLENTTLSFPSTLEAFLDLVLTNSKSIPSEELTSANFPEDLIPTLNKAYTDTTSLQESLNLNFVKSQNLLPDVKQTLFWFQFVHKGTTFQCVARTKVAAGQLDPLPLEITNIFLDKEHFSAQQKIRMKDPCTYTSDIMPLYRHSAEAKSVTSAAAKIFNNNPDVYFSKVKELIKTKNLKLNMSKTKYVLEKGEFVSRINAGGSGNVLGGIYFKATFSKDAPCYVCCEARITGDTLELNLLPLHEPTIYDTKEAVIDALQSVL